MRDKTLTLLKSLPLPRSAAEIPFEDGTYWNLLEVDTERVFRDMAEEGYLHEQLRKLDSDFLVLLIEWNGLEVLDDRSSVEILASWADQPWVQTVFYLMKFCDTRTYNSFCTAAKELIPQEQFHLIDGCFSNMQTDRLMLALRVYSEDTDNLKFLLFWENADKRSFERYALLPKLPKNDGDIDLVMQQEIEHRIERGINPLDVSRSHLNEILQEFEASKASKFHSLCHGVLQIRNDNSCWAFVKRRYRETSVPEVSRTVFADEAELIIIHFRDHLREIDIKFERKETIDLASVIACTYFNVDVEYSPVIKSTASDKIRGFLDHLMSDTDARLKLIEIDHTSSKIKGNPIITIRGDSEIGVVSALKHLNEVNGLNLYDDIDCLRKIKLLYSVPNVGRDRDRFYVVTIYFRQFFSDDRFNLTYTTRAPLNEREVFEKYMWSKYAITIVPNSK